MIGVVALVIVFGAILGPLSLWPIAIALGQRAGRRDAEQLIVLAAMAHPGDPARSLRYCRAYPTWRYPTWPWQLMSIYTIERTWTASCLAETYFEQIQRSTQ